MPPTLAEVSGRILLRDSLDVVQAIFGNDVILGARADGQQVSDGTLALGSQTLTSASARFKASDVGKVCLVSGAGASGADLLTSITGYTDPKTVTVNDAALTAVNGKDTYWGTDNKPVIDAALTNDLPVSLGGRQVGGGIFQLGAGMYLTSGGHTLPPNTMIAGLSAQATNLVHIGNNSLFTYNPGTIKNYQKAGFRHMTIWGTNLGSSGAGVEVNGSTWGPYFEHIVIGNYSNGIGLFLHNKNAGDFCEGVHLEDVTFRYNLRNVVFQRDSGNASFAYQRWISVDIHVPANGTGIDIGSNSTGQCSLNGGKISANIWLEGNNAVAVNIGANGSVDTTTEWRVVGEVIASPTGTKSLQMVSGAVFRPHGIHNFLANASPAIDTINATTFNPPTIKDVSLPSRGIFREAFALQNAQGTTAPTAGVEFATLMEFYRGEVVQGIEVVVGANGAGITLAKVAIWDSAGNLLASSADNSANFNAGSVPRTQKTSLSSPWTVPTEGAYYVGFLFVTAAPTLTRGANFTGHSVSDTAVLPSMQSAGGKTDVGNTSVNSTGTAWWVAVF